MFNKDSSLGPRNREPLIASVPIDESTRCSTKARPRRIKVSTAPWECIHVEYLLKSNHTLSKMRSALVSSFLVAAVAAAPAIEPRSGATGYEGYKVLRMETGGQLEKVKDMLSAFQYDEWTHDASRYIDFSISAKQAEKLKELGAAFNEIHSDLGKDIVDESRPCDYKGTIWKDQIVPSQAD